MALLILRSGKWFHGDIKWLRGGVVSLGKGKAIVQINFFGHYLIGSFPRAVNYKLLFLSAWSIEADLSVGQIFFGKTTTVSFGWVNFLGKKCLLSSFATAFEGIAFRTYPALQDNKPLKEKVTPDFILLTTEVLKMDSLFTDSEWETFSETGSSEQEETDFLYGNHACTILSSMEQSIGKIDEFLSFERGFGFLHGDIVRSITDPCGQMGRLTKINMSVDLENAHGKMVKNINSKQLSKIRTISVGDFVVNSNWIGRVVKVVDSVSIVFDDGSKCEVTAVDHEKLVPVFPNIIDDSQYRYYPGQRLKVVPSKVSRSTRWLCGTWSGDQDEGTVSGVDTGFVYVDWISSAHADHDLSASPPLRLQKARLDFVAMFFPFKLATCITRDYWKLGKGFERGNLHSRLEEIFAIIKTRTKVDVVWQDGTLGLELDSKNLLPVGVVNAHEFWPHQFVLEKGTIDNSQRWGVVRGVDAKERTVKVQWRNMHVNQISGFNADQIEETVSAYELVEHPDYSYCFGDIVVHNQFGDRADKGHEIFQNSSEGKNLNSYQNENPSAYCLSCIGIVIGFKDGAVEVKWVSGLTTKSDSQKGKELSNIDDADESSEKFSCSLISQDSSGRISHNAKEYDIILEEEVLETCHQCAEQDTSELQIFETTNIEQEAEEFEENNGSMLPKPGETSNKFRRFDMVSDCSDHHFLAESKALAVSQVKRSWLKKVQQEWSILEKNLPETIYVCVYEERMDLLRAALVGAPGTPYHDGLFFFDIFLPSEFPYEPPMVHYHSGGFRLNPNLYESGKVCLSLLNTWAGSDTEVWNPGKSTILQVLLSLQALVLNEKPYFNEAGYDKQLGRYEGETNSVSYNENAFLVTCQSMLYLLRKPPKHFEALVKEHFSRRAETILLACNAYMEGAPVGFALECSRNELDVNFKGSSTGSKSCLPSFSRSLWMHFQIREWIAANSGISKRITKVLVGKCKCSLHY
ncbi:putative ubiquitin-conjugating enzyme E2 38 [Hibiscus syriacus]|uniref:E2 ubiquitin-conjugating enzyme n=1 Tax=Hibiscus syriacus TaxID=106335 RepID=A0A6A3BFT5_HIBSY|nr:putative ubiquitin-conjugating enzyme E2 38 [Hibiscus syriacus]